MFSFLLMLILSLGDLSGSRTVKDISQKKLAIKEKQSYSKWETPELTETEITRLSMRSTRSETMRRRASAGPVETDSVTT